MGRKFYGVCPEKKTMAEEEKKTRYEYLSILSKTAQSSVWFVDYFCITNNVRKSRDTATGKKVAVKEIDYVDDKCCAKRCLYEIKLLRHFSHENVCVFMVKLTPR